MTDDEDRQHIIHGLRQIRDFDTETQEDIDLINRAIALLTTQGGLPCGK